MTTQYTLGCDTDGNVFVQITAPSSFKEVYGAIAMLCKLSGKGFGYMEIRVVGVVADAATGSMLILQQPTAPTVTFDAETITYIEADGTQRRVRPFQYAPCVVYITVSEENHHAAHATLAAQNAA